MHATSSMCASCFCRGPANFQISTICLETRRCGKGGVAFTRCCTRTATSVTRGRTMGSSGTTRLRSWGLRRELAARMNGRGCCWMGTATSRPYSSGRRRWLVLTRREPQRTRLSSGTTHHRRRSLGQHRLRLVWYSNIMQAERTFRTADLAKLQVISYFLVFVPTM
eukprot:SAG31_NODE_2040_length_6591_cov_8.808996_2_plen_166_part_00